MALLFDMRKAVRLSRGEWAALAQAWLALAYFDLALRIAPFPRLRAQAAVVHSADTGEEQAAPITALLNCAVNAAARRHPLRPTCLRRALALQWLLGRHGLPSELHIGVRKEDGTLQAHAWVERDGRPLGEPEAIDARFARLAGVGEAQA